MNMAHAYLMAAEVCNGSLRDRFALSMLKRQNRMVEQSYQRFVDSLAMKYATVGARMNIDITTGEITPLG